MKIWYTLVITVIYAAVVFSASGNAQETKAPSKSVVKQALKVFPSSLDSDYKGIVESTIYNVILLKKYYPEEDYSWYVKKLNKIAEVNTDPSIRLKAHLASLYLTFSNEINVEPKTQVFDREYIFKQITDQVENKLAVGY